MLLSFRVSPGNQFPIGEVSNYCGGLFVAYTEGTYAMGIGDDSSSEGCEVEEIPYSLFRSLVKHELNAMVEFDSDREVEAWLAAYNSAFECCPEDLIREGRLEMLTRMAHETVRGVA